MKSMINHINNPKGFKFSGRDLAIKRAQLEDIPVYLGSATPSLQTLKLVKEKNTRNLIS